MLVSLPDFHLDKLTVGETPIQDHIDNYNRILRGLVEKARLSYNVDEIVFVIGNDFYHTDSLHNTTTKGTGLFVGTEWDNAYELGFDLMVKSITYLKQYCNKLNKYHNNSNKLQIQSDICTKIVKSFCFYSIQRLRLPGVDSRRRTDWNSH